MTEIKNILACRYASKSMTDIWSEEGKILLEREFWIIVMKAQKQSGIDISDEAITAYEQVKNQIDLESIHKREKILRHDVKSRIEEFCHLAGFEHIHKGMTSRDLTDNTEQYQILKSLKIIHLKAVKALHLIALKAFEHKKMVIAGRTHNVAAQPTTLGKRMAMFGESLLIATENLKNLIDRYPLRGIKGAVGTLLDMKTLFQNDSEKVDRFQKQIADFLGFNQLMDAVGQVYPRALDFEVVSALLQLGSAPSCFCKTLRLMAGHELLSEGFQKGQVGSSAMPHKMNSRNCERVNGFYTILNGYVTMGSGLAGDQWNEGDVSCSVVRRVMIPDAFFAIDGLFETFLTILSEMTVFSDVIKAETDRYLPFLISTTFLMEAVKAGSGREKAHELIKHHSLSVIKDLRESKITRNNLIERLADDPEFPLSKDGLDQIIKNPDQFLGEALKQVETFCNKTKQLIQEYPKAEELTPEQLI